MLIRKAVTCLLLRGLTNLLCMVPILVYVLLHMYYALFSHSVATSLHSQTLYQIYIRELLTVLDDIFSKVFKCLNFLNELDQQNKSYYQGQKERELKRRMQLIQILILKSRIQWYLKTVASSFVCLLSCLQFLRL